jgi:hypothetical protein
VPLSFFFFLADKWDLLVGLPSFIFSPFLLKPRTAQHRTDRHVQRPRANGWEGRAAELACTPC